MSAYINSRERRSLYAIKSPAAAASAPTPDALGRHLASLEGHLRSSLDLPRPPAPAPSPAVGALGALVSAVRRGLGTEQSNGARLRAATLLVRESEADSAATRAEVDEEYGALLDANPGNAMAAKRLATLMRSAGDVKGALEVMERMVAGGRGANECGCWLEWGEMYAEVGEWGGAAFCLEEFVLLAPLDPDGHARLGECYATASASAGDGGQLALLRRARKHLSHALNLMGDAAGRAAPGATRRRIRRRTSRALLSMASVSSAFLDSETGGAEEQEAKICRALLEFACGELLEMCEGGEFSKTMGACIKDYVEDKMKVTDLL